MVWSTTMTSWPTLKAFSMMVPIQWPSSTMPNHQPTLVKMTCPFSSIYWLQLKQKSFKNVFWLNPNSKITIEQTVATSLLNNSEELWRNWTWSHQRKSFSRFWLENILTKEILEKSTISSSVPISTDLKTSSCNTRTNIQLKNNQSSTDNWEMLDPPISNQELKT